MILSARPPQILPAMAKLPEIVSSPITVERDRTAAGQELHTIVAELPNGVSLRLRRAGHLLVREIENVDRELTILGYPTDRTASQAVDTARVTTPEVWYSQWSADFYGVVDDVEVAPLPRADVQFDLLDVGVGTIYLHPTVRDYLPKSTLPLQLGDELYVPASPLVLWNCHP